jgi:hypothetical protein
MRFRVQIAVNFTKSGEFHKIKDFRNSRMGSTINLLCKLDWSPSGEFMVNARKNEI